MMGQFGLSEATMVTLLLSSLALAYRAGAIAARVDKMDDSVRAIHRRLDEFRELIGEALRERTRA
jgi:hypothetical protein